MTDTTFSTGDLVEADIYDSGPGTGHPPLGTVRAVVINVGAEYDVRVLHDNYDEARVILEDCEPGLAAEVEADSWLLRNMQPEDLRMISPLRTVAEETPAYRIDRVRKSTTEPRVNFEVFLTGDSETYADGTRRPDIEVDVWPPAEWATDEWAKDRGTQVGWPSTSDKRPALARALAAALVLAADEAERLDSEAGR